MKNPDIENTATLAASQPSQLHAILMEWRRSWRPGVTALIGGSIGWSIFTIIFSLFIEPLENQFGWSRGEIAIVFGFSLPVAFAAPVVGSLADRFGVRPVLLIGLALTAFFYVLLAAMPNSLVYFYTVYFFTSLCGLATTGITFTRILTGAFHKTRGTALAIGRTGLAASGVLLPLLLYPIIERFGSAGGFLTLAALIIFVAIPLVWFWAPHGRSADNIKTDGLKTLVQKWKNLIGNAKVRTLCVASALNYVPVIAILSQLKPLAESKGLDPALAVGAISMMSFAAAGGALISGVLVDRFWAPAVAFALNILPALGCLALMQDQVSPFVLYGAVVLVGLGQGAEIDIVAFMIARYFGLKNYSSIYGLSVFCIATGVSIGSTLIGHAYDLFGNYNIAAGIASASFAAAAICYLMMGKYPVGQKE